MSSNYDTGPDSDPLAPPPDDSRRRRIASSRQQGDNAGNAVVSDLSSSAPGIVSYADAPAAHGTQAWANPAPQKTDVGSGNPNDAYGPGPGNYKQIPIADQLAGNSGAADAFTDMSMPSQNPAPPHTRDPLGVPTPPQYEDVPSSNFADMLGASGPRGSLRSFIGAVGGNAGKAQGAMQRNAQAEKHYEDQLRLYAIQQQAEYAKNVGALPGWREFKESNPDGTFAEFKMQSAGAANVKADNPSAPRATAQMAKGPDGKLHYIMSDNTLSQYEAAPSALDTGNWSPMQGDDGSWYQQNSKTGEIRQAKFPGQTPASLTKVGGPTMAGTPDQAKTYAAAIVAGTMPPPSPIQLARQPALAAELAKSGYDLTNAGLDYHAKQRVLSSLNSTPQIRLRQAIDFADASTTKIEGIYAQLEQMGAITGSKPVNQAILGTLKTLPGEAGKTANILQAQMSHLTAELATVYQGGGTPTQESMKLASDTLNQAWNAPTFAEGVRQLHIDLDNRRKSIADTGAVTGSVLPGKGGAAPAPAPTGGLTNFHVNPQTGQRIGWDGKAWVPAPPQ